MAGLEREIEADNNNELDDPMTEDGRIEMQEDIIFYDKLLYQFEQAEKQSQELKIVPKIVVPNGRA